MAVTFWFTGLSKSGKTSIAEEIEKKLMSDGIPVKVLDGKAVRDEIGGYFGFSRSERIKVNRIIATISKYLNDAGIVTLVTSITPYNEIRDIIKKYIGNCYEIYVNTPIDTCIERDQTGNYERAIRGEIFNYIGISEPYEIPANPDLIIDNTGDLNAAVDACYSFILSVLKE